MYAVVLARTSVLSRPGIFITPWVNDCGSSAQGFSAGIALPPVGNIFTSFFNHSTGCLQPVFGEESHLPTSYPVCLPACNFPSLFLRFQTSLSHPRLINASEAPTEAPTVTRIVNTTPSSSNYLKPPPRFASCSSFPSSYLSLLYLLATRQRLCRCNQFLEPCLMLPVLHYLWLACTIFISSLVACIKWLKKNLICLLATSPHVLHFNCTSTETSQVTFTAQTLTHAKTRSVKRRLLEASTPVLILFFFFLLHTI